MAPHVVIVVANVQCLCGGGCPRDQGEVPEQG